MSTLPVPTIPVRMNNFASTFSTANYRGVTMDGLHMCWTSGSNNIVIQRIAYDNDVGTIVLKGGASDYLGTSISNFQGPTGKANIYVGGNRIWTMRQNSGQVFEWDRNGNITKFLGGEVGNFIVEDIEGDDQTLFAQYSILRRDPVDNRTIIRSYVYDNTSWASSIIVNRRNKSIFALTVDKSLDNFTGIRTNVSQYSSNDAYGLAFNGSNTLIINYVGGTNNRIYGFLDNDVNPGTVPIGNRDKVHDIFYPDSNEQTGYIGSMPRSFLGSFPSITPNVQCNSSSTGRIFSLVDFDDKHFKLVANDGNTYLRTRSVNAELLIPKAFIDPVSNTVITPSAGTFIMRMYTDGNTFGTIATVDGLQFLFLAAFPANKTTPSNNYSLGIGARKND